MEKIIARRTECFVNPAKRVGAHYVADQGVYVRLWSPHAEKVSIEWMGKGSFPLTKDGDGYFTGLFRQQKPGDRYYYHIDDQKYPDPASRFQPEGVAGPSEVVGDNFVWTEDGFTAPDIKEWVLYEIHVGTFTDRHDFDGVIQDLPRLKQLGITTLEIMPVSPFSGSRNWGYDGVFPHAVQNSYGGPEGLKRLINAAHDHGLAVILDVVYNHLGPEGNVLPAIAPYTQDKYHTPWGDALNYDGEYSDDVRRYFLQTIWQWLVEYRLDGLRLDAIQTIFDTSPVAFLQEVTALKNHIEKIEKRSIVLIAETDMNDSRVVDPLEKNGMGFDGHWADDLHHALHVLLTGENTGYYSDYEGVEQLAKIYRNGVAFESDFSPFRKRLHGKSYQHVDKFRLVVQSQNHDQAGNRLMGERLSMLTNFQKTKLAAACVLLSPFMPLLFMGEEFYTQHPFLYFISHENDELVEAVRKGRKAEWVSFGWNAEPPDPASEDTFNQCVLTENERKINPDMQEYYRQLITLSKQLRTIPLQVQCSDRRIYLNYGANTQSFEVILSFNDQALQFPLEGRAVVLQSSQDGENSGMVDSIVIPPYSATVLAR